MKYVTGVLGAVLFFLNLAEARSAVRITNDRGGLIGAYILKYERLASSGESVIIDGLCASACTMVLSALPSDRICVTSRARLGFHAAWNYGVNGRAFTDAGATSMLYSTYPTPVRRWITRKGGLSPQTIFLSGRPLQEMYRPCLSDAFSSRPQTSERGVAGLANTS
jgi:hypothetical protein